MNNIHRITLAALLAASVLTMGCGKSDDTTSTSSSTPSTSTASTNTSADTHKMPMQPNKNVAHAADVWSAAGSAYKSWTAATPKAVKGKRPHGAFIQVFYNSTAKTAIGSSGAWPEGTVIVKDNYMPNAAKNGPGMLAMVTIMQKESGGWFWAKFHPNGTLDKTPAGAPMPNMPIAGYAKLKCIACHKQSASRDMVITELAAK